MKISILINPQGSKSSAIHQAYEFIQAAIEKEYEINQVFFYGYAVDFVFSQDVDIKSWQTLSNKGLKLVACSTIAEGFVNQKAKLNQGFELVGLGQWTDSIYATDKHIEFS